MRFEPGEQATHTNPSKFSKTNERKKKRNMRLKSSGDRSSQDTIRISIKTEDSNYQTDNAVTCSPAVEEPNTYALPSK